MIRKATAGATVKSAHLGTRLPTERTTQIGIYEVCSDDAALTMAMLVGTPNLSNSFPVPGKK